MEAKIALRIDKFICAEDIPLKLTWEERARQGKIRPKSDRQSGPSWPWLALRPGKTSQSLKKDSHQKKDLTFSDGRNIY